MYKGWFLADKHFVLGIKKHETLLKRPKNGIPNGALQFENENRARQELEFLKRAGYYPLWVNGAQPEMIGWR